ncbi:uncharacterized protein LOC144442738 [Glandiceps talaboti]
MGFLAFRKIRFMFVGIVSIAVLLGLWNFYGFHSKIKANTKCPCSGRPTCSCKDLDTNIRKLQISKTNSAGRDTKNQSFLSDQSYSVYSDGGSSMDRTEDANANDTNDSGMNHTPPTDSDTKSLNTNSTILVGEGNNAARVPRTNQMKNHKHMKQGKTGQDNDVKFYNGSKNAIKPLKKKGKSNLRKEKKLAQSSCQIPQLDPYHPSIRHLIEKKPLLDCEEENGHPDISYVDKDGRLYIDRHMINEGNVNSCSYAYIARYDDDYVLFNDSVIVTFDENTEYTNDLLVTDHLTSDYFGVMCQVTHTDSEFNDMYHELHAHIVPLPHISERTQKLPSSALGIDVIIIGFDSTSSVNFIRQMPKSYKYLTETMQSVILKGYNIIGDATAAALIPMLTGDLPIDLPEARRNMPSATTVDDYPLIWKTFKELGYVTLFAEDSPYLGTFNRLFNGFVDKPTDHYMRTYWLKSVQLTDSYDSIKNPKICEGARPSHQVMLEYLKEFQVKYKDVHKFGFSFLTELTHGNINSISAADEDFYQYLEYLYEEKYLENTLFIVFGDHGARYTAIRATFQGRLEERLPFMSIHVPQTLQKSHPQILTNLKSNVQKLTTAFDFHAMLEDVVKFTPGPADRAKKGISLFKEVPSRSCREAHVDAHWCTCLDWFPVDVKNEKVQHATAEFLKFINNITEPYRDQCSVLKIKNIKHAERNTANEKLLKFKGTWDDDQRFAAFEKHALVDVHEVAVDYQITIETIPGHGLFEGTVKVYTNADGMDECLVDKEISRINLYGNQSKCIAEKYPHVTKYCYCKDYSP